MLAAVGAVIVLAAAVIVTQLPSNTAAPSTKLPPTVLTTTAASAAVATPSGTAPATTGTYQLLWPFADQDQAAAWQVSYRTGGHDPWHLDAGQTARSFTQGYLAYASIDQVTSVSQTGSDARIGVGHKAPDGTTSTAAVIHLIKVGSGQDTPWEVVGTDDTATLTLTTPAYGATVTSPATVGGRITGVDESLRVQVLRLADGKSVGQTGSIPAGGQNTAWTAQVSYAAPANSMLTIAVSTGGHVSDVERFAVTGVRSGPAANG
jgi:hypothetical protein